MKTNLLFLSILLLSIYFQNIEGSAKNGLFLKKFKKFIKNSITKFIETSNLENDMLLE